MTSSTKKNRRFRRAVFFLHEDINQKLDRLRELIARDMPIRCDVPIHSAVELAIDEAIARRERNDPTESKR